MNNLENYGVLIKNLIKKSVLSRQKEWSKLNNNYSKKPTSTFQCRKKEAKSDPERERERERERAHEQPHRGLIKI